MVSRQIQPHQVQLIRLESATPLLLAIHGIVMLVAMGGRPTIWGLVICTAALGGIDMLLSRRFELDFTLTRAVGLLLLSLLLIFLTGTTSSFFLLWFFVIAAIYPIVLRPPYNVYLPIVLGVSYLVMALFPPLQIPASVVVARAFLLLYIGLLTQKLGSILNQTALEKDALIQQASDGIFITDLDGNLLEINQQACQMIGCSRQEVLKKNIRDIVVLEADSPPLRFAELLEGRTIKGERLLRHKDGRHIPVEVSTGMISGKKLQSIVRDITERKRVEQTLLENEDFLQTAQVMAKLGAWTLDPRTNAITATDELLHILNLDRQEATLENFAGVIHPDDLETAMQHLDLGAVHGREYDIVHRLKLRNGTIKWVHTVGKPQLDGAGRVIKLLGTTQDITEGQQAEEALRESEHLLRDTLDALPAMVGILAPDGRILDGNRLPLETFGLKLEDVLGLSFAEIHPWAYSAKIQEQLREAIHKAAAGETVRQEFELPVPNGRSIVIDFQLTPITDQAGQVMYLVPSALDITESKHAEAALLESEERFSRIFHASPVGINIVELSDNCSKDVNDAFLGLVGYTRDEIIGHSAAELNLFVDPEQRSAKGSILKWSGVVHDWDTRIRRKSGEIRDVLISVDQINIHGVPMGLVVMLDITDRKQAEAALRKNEERLQSIIDNEPECVKVLDLNGRLLEMNPAGLAMIEADHLDQVIGQDVSNLVVPEHRVAFRALTNTVLEGRTGTLIFEVKGLKGARRWLETHAVPLRDQNGAINALLGITLDITERRQSEKERENLIEELTAKNAELERFTYTVSHDLKSPLVTIKGFLGYLEQHAISGNVERLREDSKRIDNAVEKMQELLNDLLELSRIGRFVNPPELIAFEDLARSTIELLQGRLNERGVTVQIQPNLPAVYGDRQRLTEVLQNLIDNAAKYMGNQPEPRIEIGQRGEEAGRPVFYVKDNGMGIAPEYRDRIFGLFNKLDARSDGTGIGLTLVRSIVEFHGGRIWVESEPEQGSTFLFTLDGAPLHQ